jgi:hypothetical protein
MYLNRHAIAPLSQSFRLFWGVNQGNDRTRPCALSKLAIVYRLRETLAARIRSLDGTQVRASVRLGNKED